MIGGACPWVSTDAPEVACGRTVSVVLQVTRPCGHDWPVSACPGHAEAFVGENDPTACHACGRVSPAFVVVR